MKRHSTTLVKRAIKLALKHPDARYTPNNKGLCRYLEGYVTNVGVGCIVGQAAQAYISRDTIKNLEGYGADGFVDSLFEEPDAWWHGRFLRSVQHYQDSGRTWGHALQLATDAWNEAAPLVNKLKKEITNA